MAKRGLNIRFALTISIAILFFLTLAILNITLVAAGINNLLDFGSFIASGQLANEGDNPYGSNSPLVFSVEFQGLKHNGFAPNLNPPITVLIFQLIADIPPLYSIQVWRCLSFLIYIYSIYLLSHHYRPGNSLLSWITIWAFSLAGFWHTIQLGQIYTLLLSLVIGIFIYTEKGAYIPAGILLGLLIAIKPNFIFWAVALSIANQWTIFITSGITALMFSFVPIYFYGIKIYEQWLAAVNLFTPNLLIFPGNNSIPGLTARFNAPQAGLLISIALSLAVLIIIYKNKPALFNVHTLSVITSLFISPIAWTGYTILTLPIFFRPSKWSTNLWIAACVFVIPFYIVLILFENNFVNFVFWGWLYGWGLLFLMINELKTSRSNKLL